jgi:ketosteroid isomerase-like protein
MKKIFFTMTALIMSSFFMAACGDQGAGNAANKPANAVTNSNTASSASSEADVRKFIGDLGAALAKNDAAALDKMWADDYTFVNPEGEVMTKAQRLDAVKSGAMKFESLTFNDVKVRMYGDTAVVNAKTSAKGTMNGKDNSGTSTATIVLVKGKDGWRVVLGHPSTSMPAGKTSETNKTAEANKTAAPANK